MKKSRMLSIILGVMLIVAMSVTLIACNDECTEHIDENNDLKCDNCEADMSPVDGGNDGGNGGNTDTPANTETYTFTLKDQNGAGVPDAIIEFTVNGKNPVSATTDATGVATANLAKDAILVQAEIVDWSSKYIIDETGPFTYEDTKSYVYDDAIKQNEYVITVVDNAGAPVEGALVQLCFGSICKTPKATSKLGKATILATEEVTNAYVSINSLPNGYSLQNGGKLNDGSIMDYAKYTNFNTNNEIQIVVDKLNVVTVTVGDLFGSKIKDIKVDIYRDADDSFVTSAISDADGKVEFVLPVDVYYFKAAHKDNNPTYTWVRHEEGMQEITASSVSTSFVIKSEVTYTFNATRTNSEYGFDGVSIRLLNRLFEEVYVASTEGYANADFDANGVATLVAPYDVYYAEVYGLGATCHADLVKMEKDGTTTYNVSIIDSEAAGTEQNPIVLHYGSNNSFDMSVSDKLFFKVIDPNGGTLVIDGPNVKVTIDDQEYTSTYDALFDSYSLQADLCTEDVAIITIEAKSDISAWQWGGINVIIEGTKDKPFAIYEDNMMTAGQLMEVDLSYGKAYYTLYANVSDATMFLWSDDDVKFYINGELKNSVPLAKDGDVTFSVVGEGEKTFMVGYYVNHVDYIVIVTKEGEMADGVVVELVYNEETIATETSVDGKVTFNEQEYVNYLVKAVVKDANIPEGYSVYQGNVNGAYFQYEMMYDADSDTEYGAYTTSYMFELIRDGSQNAPYLWHNEGISGMPTETQVELSAGEEVYYDFFGYVNDVQVPTYYVYAMGNQNIFMYKDNNADGNVDFDTATQAIFDEAKNATWMQVPVGETVIIKITATADVSFTFRCGTAVPNLTDGEDYAGAGTKNDPYVLKFGETMTTPDFIQGTGPENPSVDTYYYLYKATASATIQINTTDADVSVYVNGSFVDITSGSFDVAEGDVVSLEIRTTKEYGTEDFYSGVSFTANIEE